MTPRQHARAQAIANDERADPNERDNARRMCAEYEALHGKPKPSTTYGKRPWWTLKISIKESGVWLDNGREFRKALRALRDGRKQYDLCFEWSTVKAVQNGEVDWVWFPEREPWRMPYEMKATISDPLALLDREINRSEEVMEWVLPKVKRGAPKKRGLRDGELPGRRRVKR